MIETKPPSQADDVRDGLELAKQYLAFRRCGCCRRLTVEGYICYWCKEDDSR